MGRLKFVLPMITTFGETCAADVLELRSLDHDMRIPLVSFQENFCLAFRGPTLVSNAPAPLEVTTILCSPTSFTKP